MTGLTPTFTLAVGDLRSRTGEPVGGPTRMVVERDMDVASDAVRIELADRAGVAPGDPMQLALGHEGDESPVFVGEVAAVYPTPAGAEVRGVGMMAALLRLRVASTYEGRAAGDVVRDLLDRAGLRAGTVEAGPTLPRYSTHPGCGAHAHVRGLADRLGLELYADRRGRVMFHAPAPGTSEPYGFGRHLLDITGQLLPAVEGEVRVGGESPMSERGADTSHWLSRDDPAHRGVAGGPGGQQRVVLDPAARTKDLADRFAEGWWTVATRARRRVRVTVLGRAEVDLGDPADTTDVPDEALDGAGYVRALRHVLSTDGGFLTELTVATGGAR